jgi:hypothetical protein
MMTQLSMIRRLWRYVMTSSRILAFPLLIPVEWLDGFSWNLFMDLMPLEITLSSYVSFTR